MKFIKKLTLGIFAFLLMLSSNTFGQDSTTEENKPVYITVTKGHWSSNPDMDYSDWLKTEKEYFDKVTKKNDLIISSGFYTHYFTTDNSEILFVSVYKTWEDIEKANEITAKLVKEAWPNKEERDAFFKKQQAYYSPMHSDEIYSSMPFNKDLKTDSTKPLIYYAKKNELALNGKGSSDDFKEYFENVTAKNKYIKGYYTHRHLWGSNSREFDEVFVLNNFDDIEKMFDENQKLAEEHWPNKENRKVFFKKMNKLFTGKHGDYVYHNVPELAK
jgi:hypothetical protein